MSNIDAIYSASSALNAMSTGMAATAHNVANVNTAGFDPQKVYYQTGPNGQGVQAQVMPPPVLERNDVTVQASMSGLPPEAVNPSGTDLGREFTTMISTEHTYAANATTVRTWDQMQGTLLDIKV